MERKYRFYNIHGIVLKVDENDPIASIVDLHLSYFRSLPTDTDVAIEITGKHRSIPKQRKIGSQDFFWDGKTFKSANLSLTMEGGRLSISSYRSLPPHLFIQLQCLLRGWTLVHGAGISYRGKGVLFPARGNTGKTAVVSQLLQDPSCQLLGDDFVVLSRESQLYCFPLPFSLYHYHAPLFPLVFEKKKKILFRGLFLDLIRKAKEILGPIVRQYPLLESRLRAISPEYMVVPVTEIISRDKICNNVRLSKVIYLERYSGNQLVLDVLEKTELYRRIIGVLQYELDESPLWKDILAMSTFGLVDLHDYFNNIHKILQDALDNVQSFRLMIPNTATINELVTKILESLNEEA
jgi:hypothetical protein